MDIPEWLTKEFLQKLLTYNQNDPTSKITIIAHDVVAALSKGNNYLSNILRITIKYKDSASESIKQKSLIAKVPLQTGYFSKLNKCRIFEKEVGAYNDVLPKLNAIAQTKEENADFIAKFYKTDVDLTMIMEDLVAGGYKMADRKRQLDYEHAIVVLTNLARFHAASVKLHQSKPEMVERLGIDYLLGKEMYDEAREILDPVLGVAHVDVVCTEFEKWPETKKFVEFLRKLKSKVWDVYMETFYPDEGEFTVLNHGDVWINNMLFKYDENNRPVGLKFVDFQTLKFTSPTIDLLYFLYTSVSFDVMEKHFNDLTKFYLDKLNLYLKKYETSKRLNEDDFEQSLAKREIFSLLQCINILPFVFFECNADEETPNSDEHASTPIENEKFRTVCAKYLEKFSKKTWFQNFK